MQEAALTLALLYKHRFAGNEYYKKNSVREWSLAAARFWAGIQDPDGSFSEWWPNEHSLVATAFTTYAIAEAMIELGESDEHILLAVDRAANWLSRVKEPLVSNQEAGAALALLTASELLDKDSYASCAKKRMHELLTTQNAEGWFREYGGADMGYSTVLLSYLGKYFEKTGDQSVIASMKRLSGFLRYFVHPDGSFGGVYGSRNTAYLLPCGFKILGDAAMCGASFEGAGPSLNLDDRYLLYNAYEYLQADRFGGRMRKEQLPSKQTFTKYFDEAKVLVRSTPAYYAVANLCKGGALSVFSKKTNSPLLIDAGVNVMRSGEVLTSSWIDTDYDVSVDGGSAKVRGRLHVVKAFNVSPLSQMAARSVQTTVGKSHTFSKTLKDKMRDRLIMKSVVSNASFSRSLSFDTNKVIVTDEVSSPMKMDSASVGESLSFLYVPSSRFFQRNELGWLSFLDVDEAGAHAKLVRRVVV